MSGRVKKTATIALGVGLIAEGSKAISGGNIKQGGIMVLVGIVVVYGYELMQEVQVVDILAGMQPEENKGKDEGE